ncbi:MAG: hypothetical protein LIP01_03850 [Tannerellaceae bacterium]|nr:hypothetical protein [Tannerellaceae bacterium]
MLTFSGWDLYGNMSTMARTQGVNMLLNIFFGPILNAAAGIATQVQGAISSFAGNILVAARPQIVKNYAAGNTSYMLQLLNNTVKYTSLLLLLLSLPVILEMPFILKIWLKQVPEYTPAFCRLTLGFAFIANISTILMSGIHATGRIKRSSLWDGTLYPLVIPLSWLSFRWGSFPHAPLLVKPVICWNRLLFKRMVPENVYSGILTSPVFTIRYIPTRSHRYNSHVSNLYVLTPIIRRMDPATYRYR